MSVSSSGAEQRQRGVRGQIHEHELISYSQPVSEIQSWLNMKTRYIFVCENVFVTQKYTPNKCLSVHEVNGVCDL